MSYATYVALTTVDKSARDGWRVLAVAPQGESRTRVFERIFFSLLGNTRSLSRDDVPLEAQNLTVVSKTVAMRRFRNTWQQWSDDDRCQIDNCGKPASIDCARCDKHLCGLHQTEVERRSGFIAVVCADCAKKPGEWELTI